MLNSVIVHSQNEANIWYFGRNAGLDFNSGSPVAITDGRLITDEGCASISDEFGNLLFYTDGVRVFNKDHNIMKNGNYLHGHFSSTHSAIIIPKPNNVNHYYIFTVDAITSNKGLNYSEVKMNSENGLGEVISKNTLLLGSVTEKITGIKNSTNNTYWVVSQKWNSNEFNAYKITSRGVNTIPIKSRIGPYIGGHDSNALGQIKFSPNGRKLAIAIYGRTNQAWLFNFNKTTGILSNPILLLDEKTDSQYYGLEFSPNSNLLYIGTYHNGSLFQFDIESGNQMEILNSRYELLPSGSPLIGQLQLGPDSKIYIAKFQNKYLDCIANPNFYGQNCNYLTDHVFLNEKKACMGYLPLTKVSFMKI